MAGFVDFSYLAATINQGQAIFSTNFGESGPRTAIEPLPPIILRYNPRVDVPALKDTLRQKFLLQCNAVTAPIDNLYQYFDHYDLHVQGAEFIYAVLVEIALENSTRGKQVLDFAGRWKTENFEEFHNLTALTSNLFTEEEKQVYDEDFLNDALAELKKLRDTFSSNHTHGTSVPAAVAPVQSLAPDSGVQPDSTYSIALQAQLQAPAQENIHSSPQPQDGLSNSVLHPTNHGSALCLHLPTTAPYPLRPYLQRHNTAGVKLYVRDPTIRLDHGYSSAPVTSPVDTIPLLGEPQQHDEPRRSSSPEKSQELPIGLPLGSTLPITRSEHLSSHAEAQSIVYARSQYEADVSTPAFQQSEYSRPRNPSDLRIQVQEPVRRGPSFNPYGHPVITHTDLDVTSSSVPLFEMGMIGPETVVGNVYPGSAGLYEHSGTQPMDGAYNLGSSSLVEVKPMSFQKATVYSDEQQPAFNGSMPQPQYVPGVGSNLVQTYDHLGQRGSVGPSRGFSNDARRIDQQSAHQRRSYPGGPSGRGEQPVYTSQGSSQLVRRTSSGPKRGRQNSSSDARAYEGHYLQSHDGYSGPARFRGGRGNRNYQGYNSSARGSFPVQARPSGFSDIQWNQSAKRSPFDEVSPATPNAASSRWLADKQRAQAYEPARHEGLGWHVPSSRTSLDHAHSYDHFLRPEEEHHINSQNGPAFGSRQRSGDHYGTDLKHQPSHIMLRSSRNTHFQDTEDRQHQATEDPSRLYVGNLPSNIQESAIMDIFSRFGDVVNVSMPIPNHPSDSCYGFVQFTSDEEGLRAIEGLYDAKIEGRNVVVRVAQGKRKRYEQYQRQSDPTHRLQADKPISGQADAKHITGTGTPPPSQAASQLQHSNKSYGSVSGVPEVTNMPPARTGMIHPSGHNPKDMQRTPTRGRCSREISTTPTSRPKHKGADDQSRDLGGNMSNHASSPAHETLGNLVEVKERGLKITSQPYEQTRQTGQSRQKGKQERDIEASMKTYRLGNSGSEETQSSEQDHYGDAETRGSSVARDRNAVSGRQGQSPDRSSATLSSQKLATRGQGTCVEDPAPGANQNGYRSRSEVSQHQKQGSGGYSGNNPGRSRSYLPTKGSGNIGGELNAETPAFQVPLEVNHSRVASVQTSPKKDHDSIKSGPGSTRSTPKKPKKNSKSGNKKTSPKKTEGKNPTSVISDTAFPPLGPKSESKHSENAKPPTQFSDDAVKGYHLDKRRYEDMLLNSKATKHEAEHSNKSTTSENSEPSHTDDPFRMPQPRSPSPDPKSLPDVNTQGPGLEKQSEAVKVTGVEAGVEADAVIVTTRSKRLTYSQVASQPKKSVSQPKQKVLQTKSGGDEVTSNVKHSPQKKKSKVKAKDIDPWAVPEGEKAWGENRTVENTGKVNSKPSEERPKTPDTQILAEKEKGTDLCDEVIEAGETMARLHPPAGILPRPPTRGNA